MPYIRNCPNCGKEVHYCKRTSRDANERLEKWCFLCANRKSHKGIPRSLEARKKTSKSLTGKKRKPFTKEHLENLSKSHLGHYTSLETKEKLRIASKKAWTDGKFDKMVQQTISKSETRFLNMIEDEFGIQFDARQFELDGRFYDAKLGKTLIEIDSEWWHRLPEHRENDLLKEGVAKRNGYKLCRFEVNSERECFRKFEQYKEKIHECVIEQQGISG